MRKHLNLIQFSRFLVPLFVLLFHVKAFLFTYFHYDFTPLSNVVKSGGVYYFFVLSGFMIYYLYHSQFWNPLMLHDFIYSRIIRIYPVYWILTLCIIPIYFIFQSFGDGSERSIFTIVTSLLLIPSRNEPILGVAWSLVHTVYFYFMSLLFFSKNKVMGILGLLIWLIATISYNLSNFSESSYLVNFLLDANNLLFLSGIVCGYVVLKIKIPIPIGRAFIVLGLLGFPFAWVNEQHNIISFGLQHLTSIASILLILGFSSIDLQKNTKIPKLLRFLGDASFSIYLVHFTTMSVISNLLQKYALIQLPIYIIALLLIFLSILSGCAVYIFIEKPIHSMLKQFRRRRGNVTKEIFKEMEKTV